MLSGAGAVPAGAATAGTARPNEIGDESSASYTVPLARYCGWYGSCCTAASFSRCQLAGLSEGLDRRERVAHFLLRLGDRVGRPLPDLAARARRERRARLIVRLVGAGLVGWSTTSHRRLDALTLGMPPLTTVSIGTSRPSSSSSVSNCRTACFVGDKLPLRYARARTNFDPLSICATCPRTFVPTGNHDPVVRVHRLASPCPSPAVRRGQGESSRRARPEADVLRRRRDRSRADRTERRRVEHQQQSAGR